MVLPLPLFISLSMNFFSYFNFYQCICLVNVRHSSKYLEHISVFFALLSFRFSCLILCKPLFSQHHVALLGIFVFAFKAYTFYWSLAHTMLVFRCPRGFYLWEHWLPLWIILLLGLAKPLIASTTLVTLSSLVSICSLQLSMFFLSFSYLSFSFS